VAFFVLRAKILLRKTNHNSTERKLSLRESLDYMKMKPVKIAMIGAGHDHATCCWDTINNMKDTFEVVGITRPTDEYMWKFEGEKAHHSFKGVKFTDIDELLNMQGLEAVAIEAGKEHGAKYAKMFAERGVAVFLDKPGATNLAEFKELIDIVKEKKVTFQTGYMYRFNPVIRQAVELAKSGALGDIFAVEAHMSVPHPKEKLDWIRRYKGGSMFFLGCHLVDLICEIQGFPKEIVPMSMSTHREGSDGEDYGFAVLKYENGLSFAKTSLSEIAGFGRRQLVISGTKGTAVVHPLEDAVKGTVLTSRGYYFSVDPETNKLVKREFVSSEFDRYEGMMEYFAKQVRGLMPPHRTLEYETELLQTVLSACGDKNDIFRPEFGM